MSANSSFFSDLDALRLPSDMAAATNTREILSRVPVRKPDRHEYFRVHPDPEMSFTAMVFEDKHDRETFFVAPTMRDALLGEIKPVQLVTTITRQGTVIIWPIKLPGEDGRSNAWAETARQAAEYAKSAWIRMVSDLNLGAYRIHKAEGDFADPIWPEPSFNELLEIAFRGRIIHSEEHPVVRRLRGLT